MGTDFPKKYVWCLTRVKTYTATIGADDIWPLHADSYDKTDPKAAPTHIWVDQDAVVHRVVHFDAKGSPARALSKMADIRPVASESTRTTFGSRTTSASARIHRRPTSS